MMPVEASTMMSYCFIKECYSLEATIVEVESLSGFVYTRTARQRTILTTLAKHLVDGNVLTIGWWF
jgi:hypothetical protein